MPSLHGKNRTEAASQVAYNEKISSHIRLTLQKWSINAFGWNFKLQKHFYEIFNTYFKYNEKLY